MWITPSTISASAPGTQVSTLDSSEFCQLAERSLTWRSKPSPARTWSRRWKQARWLRLLSGRTCIPSHSSSFTEWWTSSALASPVSRFHKPGRVEASKTSDTSGLESPRASDDPDQQWFSWKTWMEFPQPSRPDSTLFSTMSSVIWKAWVSERRQDSTRRRKSAVRTSGSGGSSLVFATPTVTANQTSPSMMKHPGCRAIWPTPTVHMTQGAPPSEFTRNTPPLAALAQPPENWPTPTVMEAGKISNRPNKGQIGLSNHPSIQGTCEREPLNKSRAGLPDQDRANTIGKSQGQLNPGWVEHLMGLPPGWTQLSADWNACDSLGTE